MLDVAPASRRACRPLATTERCVFNRLRFDCNTHAAVPALARLMGASRYLVFARQDGSGLAPCVGASALDSCAVSFADDMATRLTGGWGERRAQAAASPRRFTFAAR